MKITKRFSLIEVMLCIATIGLAAFVMPANAQQSGGGQINPFATKVTVATNLPAIVTTGATSNQVGIIPVTAGNGLAIEVAFKASAGTSNVVHNFYPTVDGTNIWTVPKYVLVSTAKGTTPVTNGLILTEDQLVGLKGFRVAITNELSGTLTNLGVRIGSP